MPADVPEPSGREIEDPPPEACPLDVVASHSKLDSPFVLAESAFKEVGPAELGLCQTVVFPPREVGLCRRTCGLGYMKFAPFNSGVDCRSFPGRGR